MRKNLLKTIAVVASITMGVNAKAQVSLTKTLPPAGTSFEVWYNVNLPQNTAVPTSGANQTWDYSTLTSTKSSDFIIRQLSEAPASEKAVVPDATYFEEMVSPGLDAAWLPRLYYKDAGDYLIHIGEKTIGSSPVTVKTDTVFKFNLPYQSSAPLNFGASGTSGLFAYAGYGTLIIGNDTYHDVALLMEETAPDSSYYFFTVSPHYHRLARIFFHNGQRILNYYKPSGTPVSIPAAPSNLTTTPVNSIRLDWQDNSNNEDGFIIETTQDTLSGNWTHVDTVAADVITYIHTGLTNGVTYYYRVKAYNEAGSSAWSGISGATDGATGISTIGKNPEFDIYPNPAKDAVTVANAPVGSILSITDIAGKVLYSTSIQSEREVISTIPFKNGIYLMRVENKSTTSNRKLVVSK